MLNKKPDYMNSDQMKEVEALVASADNLDVTTVNLMSSVRYFLRTDQHKLSVKEPSVAAAEVQMKALACFFNERRDLMENAIKQINEMILTVDTQVDKLVKGGHKSKSVKLQESSIALTNKIVEIEELIVQINEAKKDQLEELRKKILKAERLRHFKHLQ